MMRIKSIGSNFCTLVAVGLFTFAISFSFASAKNCPESSALSITKKNGLPTQSQNQSPYEEKEFEKDDEVQDNLFFVCLLGEPPVPIESVHYCYRVCGYARPSGIATNLPLYLVKRALLI